MVTIVIPTYNRSDFLIRLFNYYADRDYKHWISIGDSSTGEHLERAKKAVKQFSKKLKIKFAEYPGLTEPQTTARLIETIETPYLAWVADDDFIVPKGLNECVEFLKANPDYSVAFGKGILFTIGSSGPHGEIRNFSSYDLRAIEDEAAAQRILNHLNDYSNSNFGAHRTEQFKKAYSNVVQLKDKGYTELTPNCVSTIQGKVKALNCFYLVRQTHDRRYRLPDLYDWVTGPNWHPSYQVFFETCSKELAEKDGISEEEAQEVVKQAFWSYLKNGLSRKFINSYGQGKVKSLKDTIKDKLRQNPIIRERLLPLLRSSRPEVLSLRKDPDYLAVYRAVQQLVEGT